MRPLRPLAGSHLFPIAISQLSMPRANVNTTSMHESGHTKTCIYKVNNTQIEV